jgi:CubicO group peptidase (beta-lactamase class C family)
MPELPGVRSTVVMTTSPGTADLRRTIDAERERFRVPGCAVVVVRDGEVVLAEGFGLRDVTAELPVTPATLFPIASSTKTFTAALCASLVDEGRLAWDRPVREYLPGFRMHDDVVTAQLTIRDMLAHRSGLPRHDLFWYTADEAMSRDDLVAALRHLQPNFGFRERWQYNNMMYTTAGQVAGRIHGGSFEDAVRDRLLTPLGMKRTNFSVGDLAGDPDVARPYLQRPGSSGIEQTEYASLDLVGPCGNINSCIEELAGWVLTLLGAGVNGRPPLLSDGVLQALRSPVIPLPEASPLAVGKPVGYGLGLLVEDYRGHRVTHHGGNIDGFSSQVSFVHDEGCGVVVLTNREGSALRDALPYVIYDQLLGLSPLPHGEQLLAKEEAFRTGREQAKEHRRSSGRSLPRPRPLEEYAGTYRHAGYGDLVVTVDGDELRGRRGTMSGRLEHRQLDNFDLVVALGGNEERLPVQFPSDMDGEVVAATVVLEPTVPAIRFDRVPSTEHLTHELLDRLAGEYFLGPLGARVSRRGDRDLTLSVEGSDPELLRPLRGLVFTVDTGRIEFDESGQSLVTQYGIFRRR